MIITPYHRLKKHLCHFIFVILTVFSVPAGALECSVDQLGSMPHQVLPCFLAAPNATPVSWSFVGAEHQGSITVLRYILTSQFWPDASLSQAGQDWQHNLVLYIPDTVRSSLAFLLLNGGTRYRLPDQRYSAPDRFDPLFIAQQSQTVVISVEDLPNQYLTFDDHIARREDGIIAYTWQRYMEQPGKNAFWPGHLPMTRAAIAAMDAVQHIAGEKHFPRPEQFVVAGASKRGWAAWLTTLADKRIAALIPVVIDILDTQNTLQHIYRSLQNNWPSAFVDYVQQGITARMGTTAFAKLMQVEDPLSYLSQPGYTERLAIPKYIISASGDDFFVADSVRVYYDRLPGEVTLRVLPNQRHSVDGNITTHALTEFYQLFLKRQPRPIVTWKSDTHGQLTRVTFSAVPQRVVLWSALNPTARDFRVTAGVSFTAMELTPSCDRTGCDVPLTTPPVTQGYQARFVEAHYLLGEQSFTLTTPIFITPCTYPDGRPATFVCQ